MVSLFFFFNDTATTEIYTLSLHDALPILRRLDLRELGDDLLRVAPEVRDRRADVERGQLDEQREGVRERQVEVGEGVVPGQQAAREDHVEVRAVVAVREHAVLRLPGGARGVNEGERVLEIDRLGAPLELAGVAPAAALADVLEADRVADVSRRVDDDDRAQVGQALVDLADL